MTIARATTTPKRRRTPPPQDRYRAVARQAKQRRARRGMPPIVSGIVWGIVLASAALVADTTAGGFAHLAGSAGTYVAGLIPDAVPVGELTVSETTGQVGAAPTA